MKIKLEVAYTNEETISQLDSALEEIEDIKVEKFEQNGFDGFDLLYYFLETGTAVVLIEKLCKIIIAFIKRNDSKSFKANGIECVGYSEKEVEKLVEKIKESTKNNNKYKWYREGMESYQRKKLVVFFCFKNRDLLKKLL